MTYQPSQERRAVLLVHAAFVLTGIVVTMLGPLVPILSARWMISDAAAGGLFTAQFTGSTLGVGLSSLLLPRRGFRAVLALGLFWMALGVAGLGFAGWPNGIAAVFFYGVGFGIAIPTGNLLISKMFPHGDAAALNLLNMSWGIGAIAGPIAIATLVRVQHIGALYWTLATLLTACGLSVAWSSSIRTDSAATSSAVTISQPGRWEWKFAIVFGVLFFLYVGSENAFSGWVASYAKRVSGSDSIWALTPSFFWVTLVGGRGLAPLALRKFSPRTVANSGLILACIGTASLLASNHMWTSLLSALLAGLGYAPVYPIMISALSRRYGDRAQRIAGFMFALAGMGGAVMPWVVGLVADRYDSLRLGLAVPLAGALIMLLLQLVEGQPSGRVSNSGL
jgi:fucose permease